MVSLLKFALVGTTGLVIDFSITWLLRDGLFINEYIASGGGFVMAATSNYYLNSKWTFKNKATAPARQFLLFFMISLVGLGLHIILLHIFQDLHITFYIAKVLAIGCVLLWNFSANSLITFRTKKANQSISSSIPQSHHQRPSMPTISNHILFIGFVLLLTANACRQKEPAATPAAYTITLDSTLGIGKKMQWLDLPGRIIAFNPDSANKIIVIGEKGKIINSIYAGAGSPDQPQSLNNIAVDSTNREIYIYSPKQHAIFVYDADGNYKNKISIQKVHYGKFYRVKGRFVFADRKDSLQEDRNEKLYIVDSTGNYVDGW